MVTKGRIYHHLERRQVDNEYEDIRVYEPEIDEDFVETKNKEFHKLIYRAARTVLMAFRAVFVVDEEPEYYFWDALYESLLQLASAVEKRYLSRPASGRKGKTRQKE